MRVVVYTADVGSHDDVWTPVEQATPEGWEVEWVRLEGDLFRRTGDLDPWDLRWLGHHVDPASGYSDRLLARWAKCHPHVLFPEADATIWVDACLEVTSPDFVRDAVGQVHPSSPYGAFVHPDRETIVSEVIAADTLAKYEGNRHAEMAWCYADTIGRDVIGLWAMTVLVRRRHYACRLIDHLVWSETLRWSTDEVTALDQIILPWVLDVRDDDLVPLAAPHLTDYHEPGTLWANAWFTRHPHRRES